jgi:photosystem II stability/assembly factor-like uncharacterized protein
MRRSLFCCTVIAFALLSTTSAPSTAQGLAQAPPKLLDRLPFRSIGPATMGGRVDDVAVYERRSATFYIGAATGGVWKTLNNGTTWEPVFDHQGVASIGALAVAQDDPDVVWVGTGENNNRQSSSWGAGVYKSTDGGRTWNSVGLKESRHIGRIVLDPRNHDVVYLAATGHLWGPNPERGVYKTTDGGATWSRVLFVDDDTGATDLAMDPSDPSVLYAAMYQRRRAVWGFNGGGPGSGLYKSTDAGATWTKLEQGIPGGPLGRIAVDVYRSNPNIVYALVQAADSSGLYRSDDAGAHWTKRSDTDPRPNYFSQVRVDPKDASRVYVLGVRVMISDDAGHEFREVRLPSTGPTGGRPRDDLDVHAMWIDSTDPAHLVIGADVGVAVSHDRGATWDYVNNLPLGQFYHVGYDMDTPYRVYGGLQDNDVWGGPSNALDPFGIGNRDWFTLTIGDGFVTLADPRDSRIVYGETQNGSVSRIDRETGEQISIRPRAANGEPPLRWAWDTPFLISPHDANTLLVAAQKVFRSTDRGATWEAVSPDLTGGADRDTLSLMGVAGNDITMSKNDGIAAWPTLVSLTESPVRPGVYYAGADDGRVHGSRDGGRTWTDLTGRLPGLPAGAVPERLVASAFDEGTVYATFDDHAQDDYAPFVFMSGDFGKTWASLASTLPAGEVVNCLTEDPRNRDVLYLGTEAGLFVSLDRGAHWLPWRSNLPAVPIDEITIHPRDNDMLLATHGRSIWVLDDLGPVQEAAGAARAKAYLFAIDPAVELLVKNDFAGYPGDRSFWGQNPEPGASLSWYLQDSARSVEISVRDSSGAVVRHMGEDDLTEPATPGLHHASWDLRHQPLAPTPAPGRGGGSRFRRSSPGPFVLPGDYRVELTVDGSPAGTRTVHVSRDPRLRIAWSDLVVLHDVTLWLHEIQGVMNEVGVALDSATAQVEAAQEILKGAAGAPQRLRALADSSSGLLAELTGELGVAARMGFGRGGPGAGADELRNRIPGLQRELMSWTGKVTSRQLGEVERAGTDLGALVTRLNAVLTEGLPSLYTGLAAAGLNPPPRYPIPPVAFHLRIWEEVNDGG